MLRVYQNEEKLADLMLATARVFGQCELREATPSPKSIAIATNLNQPDLAYYNSILCETGFNDNGDFFPVYDTWNARHTPVDKPWNRDHNRDDIIGHITDCQVMDSQGNVIPSDTPFEKVPDSFKIYDQGVIYQVRESEREQTKINQLLQEIANGKWWVSMECLFDDFGYVLVPKAERWTKSDLSQATFIERDEQTSFLTKHLRVYGGSGMYEGLAIGRVLKKFTFAGKGVVEHPANPTSAIYTFDGVPLSGRLPARGSKSLVYPISGANKMNEEEFKKTIADLEAKLKVSEASLSEALLSLKAESDAKAALANEITTTKEQLVVANTTLEQINTELNTIKATIRFDKIVNAVKAAYKIVDEAKAKEIANTLVPLPDNVVEASLKAVAEHLPAPQTPPPSDPAVPVKGAPKPVLNISLGGIKEEITEPAGAQSVQADNDTHNKLVGELKSLFKRK